MTTNNNMAQHVSDSILRRAAKGRPALIPYITAGFPTLDAFPQQLRALAPHAAAIEVGVPFSDPMADGVTIQGSSRKALLNGVTLRWILDQLSTLTAGSQTATPHWPQQPPIALMSYLNPVISSFGSGRSGLRTLALGCRAAGVSLLIVPDLPLEESGDLREELHKQHVGLVQLVSPVTPEHRARTIAHASDGFLYAVTVTGVTGASSRSAATNANAPQQTHATPDYLARLRALSPVPVCAGFGIRTRASVDALAGHCDGAIVGSALIDAIEQGHDPAALLASMA
jgi:tryptophan synthase alpha chain